MNRMCIHFCEEHGPVALRKGSRDFGVLFKDPDLDFVSSESVEESRQPHRLQNGGSGETYYLLSLE